MDTIMEWLIQWFCENAGQDEDEIRDSIDDNYFDKGFIDSFAFISLLGDIEDEFQIEFSNDQFEDRSFSTISGLAGIIEEITGE
ncbi:MAG: acyl carrier protein [Lachnospiraceae bacterium]|nr:acyl carrier protein [Lachnospiraceae bacterium]